MADKRQAYVDSMVAISVDVTYALEEIDTMRAVDMGREAIGSEPFYGEDVIAKRALALIDGMRANHETYKGARSAYLWAKNER